MIAYRKISELVEENYSYAYVLDCFGIEFYKLEDQTLGDACFQNKVLIDHVRQSIKNLSNHSRIDPQLLERGSIGLVVAYLKHSHHVFVKRSLPYMSKLIKELNKTDYLFPQIICDLQVVFPLFVEDFIRHIHEEEDLLFSYINKLLKIDKGELVYTKAFFDLESMNLMDVALDHSDTDDEMAGIRKLTSNYKIGVESDLLLAVLFKELRQFENDLVFHANIENKILFTKAFELEARVKSKISKFIPQN
ncbi:MAG: iron-sulfur cluster repair di-iron protein [Bacteroidetes bacterium]|nr:iron-sulfur cluster repair di-iron protein [Bacteroidota bacterium]MDA1119142.1 iron-sulfur cluster repair di-iron protein [Bacteroidota bacterium]